MAGRSKVEYRESTMRKARKMIFPTRYTGFDMRISRPNLVNGIVAGVMNDIPQIINQREPLIIRTPMLKHARQLIKSLGLNSIRPEHTGNTAHSASSPCAALFPDPPQP